MEFMDTLSAVSKESSSWYGAISASLVPVKAEKEAQAIAKPASNLYLAFFSAEEMARIA